MFHLEQSLTLWREQMLATGIGSPVPLEELEAHLREEIERQRQSGLSEPDAFHAAVQTLGPAAPLKTEFTKTAGFWSWFGDNNFTRTNRILGSLWTMLFVSALLKIAVDMFFPHLEIGLHTYPGAMISFTIPGLFVILLYLLFIKAGLSLFRGENSGRRIIRIIAWLGLASVVTGLATSQTISTGGCLFAALAIVTLWLLYSPQYGNPKPAN